MFCPKCGKQMPDGAKFCSGCGSALASAGAQPQRSTPGAYAPNEQQQGAPAKKMTWRQRRKQIMAEMPPPTPAQKTIELVMPFCCFIGYILLGLLLTKTISIRGLIKYEAISMVEFATRESNPFSSINFYLAIVPVVCLFLILIDWLVVNKSRRMRTHAPVGTLVAVILDAGAYVFAIARLHDEYAPLRTVTIEPTALGWLYLALCFILFILVVIALIAYIKEPNRQN